MFRSPGRNQRSKGVRVKHVLQICFLLAICFWLIYQVKHSHDKKKLFDETDAKQTVRPQPTGDVLKLGRKDPIPKEEKLGSDNGKLHEETEDEETIGDEEENKNEEVTQEEAGDREDEGGGDGVDEIDEHELEKSDEEVDREEVTEEEKGEEENGGKENNEKDDEDSGDSSENENALKEQDVEDETTESTHEAREENYKADDASSAVTQTSQTMASDKGVEKSKELVGKDSLGDENIVNNTNNDSSDLKSTASSGEGREIAEIDGLPDTTTNDAVEKVAAKSNDASLLSASALSEKYHQLMNDTAQINTGSNHSSVLNETETEADRSLLKNVTLEDTTSKDVSAQTTDLDLVRNSSLSSSNNEAGSIKVTSLESHDASSSDSAVFLSSKNSISSSGEAEGNMQSSDTKSNINNEAKPSTTDANALTMNDVTLGSENVDEVHHDPIDSSDSSTNLEEKNDDKDLEILANVLNEDGNNEIAAE